MLCIKLQITQFVCPVVTSIFLYPSTEKSKILLSASNYILPLVRVETIVTTLQNSKFLMTTILTMHSKLRHTLDSPNTEIADFNMARVRAVHPHCTV
jgi:hypothetical protein